MEERRARVLKSVCKLDANSESSRRNEKGIRKMMMMMTSDEQVDKRDCDSKFV